MQFKLSEYVNAKMWRKSIKKIITNTSYLHQLYTVNMYNQLDFSAHMDEQLDNAARCGVTTNSKV